MFKMKEILISLAIFAVPGCANMQTQVKADGQIVVDCAAPQIVEQIPAALEAFEAVVNKQDIPAEDAAKLQAFSADVLSCAAKKMIGQ